MSELTEKELKNTINVDGQEYNINAKTAEIAKKVENTLTIQRTDIDGNTVNAVTFDGTNEQTITIVSADGGKFNGEIAVPTIPKNKRTEIKDKTVLNYGDIRDIVITNLSNTSVLYTWNGENLSPSTDDENAIKSISIVQGAENKINKFDDINRENGTLPAYFYVCSDSNNIYFGTTDSTVVRLAVEAEKLIGTLNNKKLELTAANIKEELNDLSGRLNNIIDGETEIPKADKANRATQADSAANAETATNAVNIFVNEDKTEIISGIYINDTLNKLIDGTTPAGNADTLDGNHGDYFQKKITVNTREPKDAEGVDGDIWIVYKATT